LYGEDFGTPIKVLDSVAAGCGAQIKMLDSVATGCGAGSRRKGKGKRRKGRGTIIIKREELRIVGWAASRRKDSVFSFTMQGKKNSD
jgi:hypothetical protein